MDDLNACHHDIPPEIGQVRACTMYLSTRTSTYNVYIRLKYRQVQDFLENKTSINNLKSVVNCNCTQ